MSDDVEPYALMRLGPGGMECAHGRCVSQSGEWAYQVPEDWKPHKWDCILCGGRFRSSNSADFEAFRENAVEALMLLGASESLAKQLCDKAEQFREIEL